MKKLVGLAVLVFVLMMFVGGCSDDGDDNSHTECVWGEWVVIRAATCLVGGEETSACNVCSKTRTRPTEVLGHNLSDWTINTPATCMLAGEEISTCIRGSCTYSENRPIAALEHNMGDWDTTKVAICGGEAGSRTISCKRADCPHAITESIVAPNHNWGASGVIITPATCTEAGERGQVCSLCGDTRNVTPISILTHIWSSWEITTPPECDQDGEETRICTIENCEHSEKRAISTNCITISTAAELAAFRDAVNAGDNFLGRTVTLTTDIQLSGAWVPIGSLNRQFRGTFDGSGRTISGVDINSANHSQGFFYDIHGIVKNLNLDVAISGSRVVGGISAYNSGIIINIGVSGAIVGQSDHIGGLVGLNSGRIENSRSTAIMSGGHGGNDGGGVGGLVGTNSGGLISSSYATGNISVTGFVNIYIGGLVGLNSGRIENSYATGNLSVNSSSWTVFAGGLTGDNRVGGRVVNSFATGNINSTGNATHRLGGLIGVNYVDLVGVANSFYNIETTGQNDDDGRGIPKTTAEMRVEATFTNWDFSTIWGISPTINDGYPHLRVFQ